MVFGLKPIGKLDTSKKLQVLDRIKVLHGPRTQTYGETNTSRKLWILDRTKVLHGPQTQTYEETRYFQKTLGTRQN